MNKLYKISFIAVVAANFFTNSAFAQVGNDNPTGTSGEFSGDVTTGCRYDPQTGCAKRSVTDLTVSGSVTYPLAFTRTSTSRYDSVFATDLGGTGMWLHSYGWSIDAVYTSTSIPHPQDWDVRSPDGSRLHFGAENGQNGNEYLCSPGVPYRLQAIWDTNTSGRVYILLPDGGRIWFSTSRSNLGRQYYYFSYTLQGIIDPYGQTTRVSNSGGVTTITEPAGRWIKLYYRTITQPSQGVVGNSVVDHITASDGRSVQYNYTAYLTPNGTRYTSLSSVVYFGDSSLTATYTYKNDNVTPDVRPLLSTCIDPMYAGPMWKIAYTYAPSGTNPDGSSVVSGQIKSENYFDGTNVGVAVSTLTIAPNPSPSPSPPATLTTRQETRGDGKTRTFTYDRILTSYTDFKGNTITQSPGIFYYVNAITDRKGNTTTFDRDFRTGNVTQVTYPATPNDAPSPAPQGTVKYSYVSPACGGGNTCDPNNQDSNNPYWLFSATDEGGQTTYFLRDSNHRITRVNYPDSGTESFTYNSFGQVLTHVMKPGGTESFSYDSRGLKQTYRDPYHASGNPTAWYQYDSLDRVSGVTDALGLASGDINHTTSFTYNSRGQLLVTTLPVDPVDGQRHAIVNAYNSPVGTLANTTDQLGHVTSFTYDDYRRLRSLTTPGHNTPVTAYSYYDSNGTGEDYTLTYPTVTHVVSPDGKKITTAYDENRRKISLTAGDGTSDAATTTFGYDNNGNVTSVISPNEQPGQLYAGLSTVTAYDERNRIMSATDALSNATTFKYDAAGRKASLTRANGQTMTYDSYDAMNRLLQRTVKQTPDPDAVTKYTYYTSGLLHTMQDPRLVANNSSYNYSYNYDQMGRKTGLTYPPDSNNVQRTESWHYDTVGRVDTFTNRAGNVQTLTYDALYRQTGFSWNDSGTTPAVTFGYDVGSRITSIANATATISRSYLNDNLLNTETTTYADNTPRTVTYTYNADGNRATIQYPSGAYSFTYNYTNRNQLLTLVNNASNATVTTYGYGPNGNLVSRVPDNNAGSACTYDALDRVTHIAHLFSGDTRTFDYAYDSVGNRKWTKRDSGNGDVFGYDLNDQSMSVLLNVSNPDTTSPGSQTINYDANGNRTTFSAYGPTDSYTTNNLNQYTSRNSSNATYDNNGNIITGLDGSTYAYDSQNRLLSATKAGTTETFKYDGLNRQVSRIIGAGSPLYNVYDGWNLIAEYASGATSPSTAYLSGAGGLVKNLITNNYYYQDASGSTSHLADNAGHLLEWYRYDLQGTPVFYNALNTQLSTSNYSVRHLFTGQQWYSEISLYDLRHRFYSPDIGRFLQPDPIGFYGDPANLYRYGGNNPPNLADPTGLYWPGAPSPDAGQFFKGFGAFSGGLALTIGGFASSEFLVGIPLVFTGTVSMTYGATNMAASFSSDSVVRSAALDMPQNGGALVGVTFAGEQGQFYGGLADDLAGVATARTWLEKLSSALNVIQDLNDINLKSADAATVEQEMTNAAKTFENPSLAQNFSTGAFAGNIGLSLQNFGTIGGIGSFGAGGMSLWGDWGAYNNFNAAVPFGMGGWPFGDPYGDGSQVLVGDESTAFQAAQAAGGCSNPPCKKEQ